MRVLRDLGEHLATLARQAGQERSPIIICGCPRSGTRLMARILGGCRGHFLITEHSDKRICPEDRSRLDDSVLWWAAFDYPGGPRGRRGRPAVDVPHARPEGVERLRDIYLGAAGDKRLVIKNPAHLLRVPVLEEMFPDARFVYCVRSPWHTIGSMLTKRSDAFILRTPKTMKQPDDLLLRATTSWHEAIDLYREHRTSRWIAVKYEDVVGDTSATLERVFTFLRISDRQGLQRGAGLVQGSARDVALIRRSVQESPYRDEMLAMIAAGAEEFGYDAGASRREVALRR
jgi:hypothetical protein